MQGLTRDNNETIGFVIACLFASAISISELKKWCADIVIQNNSVNEIPDYIFDLIEFNQSLMHIFNTIGFVPSWTRTDDEDDALIGIAAHRNRLASDVPLSAIQAKQKLNEQPQILDKFKATFPFINLSI